MININEIEKFVTKYYLENNPKENIYHNIDHIKEVVDMSRTIAENLGISDSELNILLSAAWFHDIGHIKTWQNHEELSAHFASSYLKKCNCLNENIKLITGCIIATIIPHSPKNKLEEIICDADVSHIGLPTFFEKSTALRLEIEKRKSKKFSDLEWIKENIEFVNSTYFFTDYAKSNFENQKNINLLKLNELYISLK
jgi:predicted metal-dependent HD superfamily phosphohydrolase